VVPHASLGVTPEEVAGTEALVLTPTGGPMAELVRVQRLSVALAAPRGSTRTDATSADPVILSSQPG
jgi:hypothetical protein